MVEELLATPEALARREAALAAPHLASLERWRAGLEARLGRPVPHLDPRDGGTAARLLLLLETPGPGAAPLRFVSRDNPTGTGRNLRRFLGQAGIARGDLLVWNAVPWVIHAPGARNRQPRAGEIRDGLALLPELFALLPHLRGAVLAGRVAALAAPLLAGRGLATVAVPHPSPTICCTSPAVPARIVAGLREAAGWLEPPAGALVPPA